MLTQPNPKGGRPKTGSRFPRQLGIYLSDRGLTDLQRIANEWECSQSEAVRRLIREKAASLGFQDAEE